MSSLLHTGRAPRCCSGSLSPRPKASQHGDRSSDFLQNLSLRLALTPWMYSRPRRLLLTRGLCKVRCLGWSLRRCSTQHGPHDSVATAKRDALTVEKPLAPHQAERIEQTLKPAKSAEGLFITTSTFAEGVHEVCSGQRLDLIDGATPQEYLDRHFGAGVYYIRV